jgi:hypothetical protein
VTLTANTTSSNQQSISNYAINGTCNGGICAFGFGATNYTNTSWYYEPLFNISTYTQFQSNYPGLGLSNWTGFSTLLGLASNNTPGWSNSSLTGFSSINNTSCSNYSAVLEQFSFQIQWSSNASYYLTVPLSTFATINSQGGCTLNIFAASFEIFGAPFFSNYFANFV